MFWVVEEVEAVFVEMDETIIHLNEIIIEVDGRCIHLDGRIIEVNEDIIQMDGRVIEVDGASIRGAVPMGQKPGFPLSQRDTS